MLLYDSPISGNCYKVRLILAHLGLEYETVEMSVFDRSDRPAVLGALNPSLRLPTLVLDDGQPLAESNAILSYFAEGTEYLPEDRHERAQVMRWLFFEQSSHLPNFAAARFLVRWVDGAPEAVVEEKRRGGYGALDVMELHLCEHRFMAGDRYTIADMALYAYTHVAHEGGIDLSGYPAVREWLDRVAAQPGHVPMTAEASAVR